MSKHWFDPDIFDFDVRYRKEEDRVRAQLLRLENEKQRIKQQKQEVGYSAIYLTMQVYYLPSNRKYTIRQ